MSCATEKNFSIEGSRYELEFRELKYLGEGSNCKVYLCENLLDKRQYAVKKIYFEENENTKKEDLLREVYALAKLRCKNIVRYYQVWTERGNFDDTHTSLDSCLYILMEYCPSNLVKELSLPLPPSIAWKYFHQIVIAVAYMHERKIVHGDLSRNNIFLDNYMNVKVGSFRHAVDLERDNVCSSWSIERSIHVAPEMEGENVNINEKADIFSLGILLFEVLCHFNDEDERMRTLKAVREGEIQPNFKFQEHTPFILELLSPSPSDRPTANQILDRNLPWPGTGPTYIADLEKEVQSLIAKLAGGTYSTQHFGAANLASDGISQK